MKIGIISDTHDNLVQVEKAVKFFTRAKVELVLHAGDFVAPFTVFRLKKLACEWRGVFGNNDGEKNGLRSASEGRIVRGPLRMRVGDLRVAVAHDIRTLDLKKEKAVLVIFGHTHKPEIINAPGQLLVNPGECGGWLTGKSTVAVADTDKLSARIYTL
jgi:putative phosphoesterase